MHRRRCCAGCGCRLWPCLLEKAAESTLLLCLQLLCRNYFCKNLHANILSQGTLEDRVVMQLQNTLLNTLLGLLVLLVQAEQDTAHLPHVVHNERE